MNMCAREFAKSIIVLGKTPLCATQKHKVYISLNEINNFLKRQHHYACIVTTSAFIDECRLRCYFQILLQPRACMPFAIAATL